MATESPRKPAGPPVKGTQLTSDDSAAKLAQLSPEQQRVLLAKLLREKAERAKSFPMSEGQQGLWHAFRRDPTTTPFNVFLPTRVRSRLDLPALRAAIEQIAQRHASLRTTFSDQGGVLAQRIQDSLPPEFAVVPLEGARDEAIRDAISREARRPFDLEVGPLLRITAYRIAADDFVILAATHHIVTDFWSLVLILNELRQLYPALAQGTQPLLPPAPNNYSEFVTEQAKLLDGEQGAKLKAFWSETLSGASTVVDLPTDFVRPLQFTGRAAVEQLQFSEGTAKRLAAFAARNRVTAFAVVQAALQVLISRYSGQDAFLVGTPFVGRNHRKYEGTVGFFVNMLPLRANLDGKDSFAKLASRCASTSLEALEHEHYPISRIVHDLAIPRDPSRSPLFQVSCTFEKSQLREESGRAGFLFPGAKQVWDFGGLQQESFYVPHQTCHYDLEFIFEQTETALRGMICYCKDLFTAETVALISKNFGGLLEALLHHSEQPLARVPWRLECPLRKSPTLPDVSGLALQTVDAFIGTQAETNAEQTAMRFGEQSISYRQLHATSSRIANRLRAAGATAGSIIPVVAKRGPAAFAAMLAANQIGAAFVPIDANQPAIDLASLAEQTQAAIALVQAGAMDSAWPQACSMQPLVFEWEWSEVAEDVRSTHVDSDLAYVVFTSGSTGKPKGVMVEHAAVCNTLQWRKRDVPLEPGDRVLMLLSHQFDAALGVAWTALTQGATLIMPDDEVLKDPSRLMDLIVREQVSVLPAPPSLLDVIVSHPEFPAYAPQLKYVWTGGEAMPPEMPARIRALTTAKFFNFYGPTEAAIEATFCEVSGHDANRPVPIGRAVANTEILILSEHQEVVPDTVPGEIAIAGRGLARGYLNDSELTSQKFVPHPLDSQSSVYLTGDRGRVNAQGEVEFLGRTDHQVKLRGYRIELGEIETHLEAHRRVQRAAVKIIDKGTAEAQLIAFVLLEGNPADNNAELASVRRHLAERLPAYKLPAAIIAVDEMPLTTSGKVDRKRLPDQISISWLQQPVVEPVTPLEEYLVAAWKKVLSTQTVGINQNFFDAGGSSLQAAMLTTQLSEDLGVPVPTALLFDLADISKIAMKLVELHPATMTERFGSDCIALQVERSAHSNSSTPDYHTLIVPIKPAGSRLPLFMVHPPGGIVVCYRELAKLLGDQYPLYGIRSHGLHGHETLPESLVAMAAEYVSALRTVQPNGPYTLGGWSLGGLIAYEMAQQLLDSGQKVQRIVLLDTTIPEGASELVPAAEQVNVGLEYGIELTLDQLGELAPEEQLPFLLEHAQKLGVLDESSPPEVIAKALEDLQSLFHHHVSVASKYQLLPTVAPISLFRPTEVPFELQVTQDRGWKYLSPQVEVLFVPGHHHSMVQPPHVEVLARKLTTQLESRPIGKA